MTSVDGRRHTVAAAIAACALAGTATSANAAQVYFQNFDALNGGVSASNYFVPGTTIDQLGFDLLHSSDGVSCAGGGGGCLDLESVSGYGRATSTNGFAAKAGDTVTLSFDMSDSQRGTSQDRFFAGFRFDATISPGLVLSRDGAWGPGMLPPLPATSGVSVIGDIFGPFGFRHYTLSFVAPQDMTVKLRFGGGSPGGPIPSTPAPDNVGALLDNLSLDITSPTRAVPEPGTWAMMLLGFGGMGAALRRHRSALA